MSLAIKELPKDYSKAFASLDPENPYYQVNVGMFALHTELPSVKSYVYLPAEVECSARSVSLITPKGKDSISLFLSSGWKEIADEEKIVIFLVEVESDENGVVQEAIALIDKAIDDKTHYDVQRFCSYLVGYGDGGEAAFRYAVGHPSSFAGVGIAGSFGNSSLSFDWLEVRHVPLPGVFALSEMNDDVERAVNILRNMNDCEGPLVDGGMTRYLASQRQKCDLVNAQLVAQVVVEVDPSFALPVPSAARMVWKELRKVIRTSGIGPGCLHPYRTPEEWGLVRMERTCGSVMRHWYEYVPERRVSREKKRPLVVFLHGGSQTGKTCLYATEWMNVAESRDFILVAPTGTMRDFGADGAPHPAWNASDSQTLFDDEAFIRAMVEDICSRHEVDRSRVYVAGHSMGSAMTQRCALALPDLFAAVASNSGVVAGGFMGGFDASGIRDDVPMPAVWIQMGEHDVGGGTLESNKKAERNVRYWIERGGLDPFDRPRLYGCGRYKTFTWMNKSGAPLLSYTTTLDKPHAITPQDAWFYYDEFFCKFSRDESGVINYLGRAV